MLSRSILRWEELEEWAIVWKLKKDKVTRIEAKLNQIQSSKEQQKIRLDSKKRKRQKMSIQSVS